MLIVEADTVPDGAHFVPVLQTKFVFRWNYKELASATALIVLWCAGRVYRW